jgi:ectoine hydroxylase-related dioxygenase (phytanoyl-CoA dioxygenase family)
VTTAELHELNRGFAWPDHDLDAPRRLLTAEQIRQFDHNGFFVLEDAFSPELVARMIAEIDPFEAELEELVRNAGGTLFIARADEITFTVHLVARSEFLRDLAMSSPLVDLAHDLVGPNTRMYWDQSVYKKPGTEAPFPWHQDNGYTFVVPQAYLTLWIALTDTDENNGCPWVVPGVHRRGTLAHHLTDLGYVCLDEAPDAVAVPARAGSIVVFSSLTPHSTGPNRTALTRKSWIVQYAPDGALIHQRREAGYELVEAVAPERQFPVVVDGDVVSTLRP